ncbi:MAG: hypothetical protein H6697_07490 [Myxococcales bacterium]|nr:hypothetical protein [Myxococcales bacterium]
MAATPVDEPISTFGEVAVHPNAAFLSVAGTGPNDVLASRRAAGCGQAGDAVALLTATRVTAVETNTPHDLWWCTPSRRGLTFVGGAGATVLRIENDEVVRTPTPAFFGNTVYGLWAPSPDDMWAVGGFAGRAGFAWHWDGESGRTLSSRTISRVMASRSPALFKGGGRSTDDVWAVGGLGDGAPRGRTGMVSEVPTETRASRSSP